MCSGIKNRYIQSGGWRYLRGDDLWMNHKDEQNLVKWREGVPNRRTCNNRLEEDGHYHGKYSGQLIQY